MRQNGKIWKIRKTLGAALLVMAPVLAGAENAASLAVSVSSRPEVQLALTQKFTIPFLQGDGPLTEGNNLSPVLGATISPVSLGGTTQLLWTPIAFLQFTLGAEAATGWNADFFGKTSVGIGRNVPDNEQKTSVEGSAFDGAQYFFRLGGTLQFDLGAVYPGAWHHLAFLTYHEAAYGAYTAAGKGEPWYMLNDTGENRNGFTYYGTFVLAYQMPLPLKMAGLMAEARQYLTPLENGGQWGDTRARWTVGALFDFEVTPAISATLITQFWTLRRYQEGLEYHTATYFQNRHLEEDNPWTLEFYRVAAVFTFQLR